MDIPDKLATQGIQDKYKHNKARAGHHYTQANINNLNVCGCSPSLIIKMIS